MFYQAKRYGVRTAIALLVMLVLLAGCGSSNQKPSNSSNETGGSDKEQSTAYTVKHAMGETPIPAPPKRVVILTNEGTEALLALGIKPVGAVKSWIGDPWYEHIADQMEGVVNLGTESEPDIEKIVELQPDLIIGNKMRQEKIYDTLSAIAPTVFAETLRGEWKNNFSLYAEAVHLQDKGKEVIAQFDSRIDNFRDKAGDKLDTEVSVVRFLAGNVRIYYKQTFSGIIFEQIGLKRPASQEVDDFVAEVTKERVPEMDGDMLFYFTYETGEGEATKLEQEWLKDPLWNNLEVVKAGKAFKVSDPIWNTAGGVLAANLMLDDLYRYFEIAE